MLLTTAVLASGRIFAQTPSRRTKEGREDTGDEDDGAWSVDGTWARSDANVGTWAGSNVDCGDCRQLCH